MWQYITRQTRCFHLSLAANLPQTPNRWKPSSTKHYWPSSSIVLHAAYGGNTRYENAISEKSTSKSKSLYSDSNLMKAKQTVSKLQGRSFTSMIVNVSPSAIKPYLHLIRFDKPIGSWLLFLPSSWSIAMAAEAGKFPDWKMLGLFGIGSVLLRGAGCVINDMWDSNFDKRVARTRSRPLAAGDVTYMQALGFLAGILTCGLMILLSFNWYSIFLGASSMAFVVSYPLMKRFTYLPQVFLGLTINWGALLGWSAVKGSCDWSVVLPLYAACCFWTVIYDTIYAHQDKVDDAVIGVKSTALLFKERTPFWLGLFSVNMISFLAVSGMMANQTFPYYLALGCVASHIGWQTLTTNLNDSNDCLEKFKSNKWLGILLLSGIICGNLLKPSEEEQKDIS